jgi:hypothetical protein
MFGIDLTSTLLSALLPEVGWRTFPRQLASLFIFPGLVTTERLVYNKCTSIVVLSGSLRLAWSTTDEWKGRIEEERRSIPSIQFACSFQHRDYLFVRKASAGAVVYVWPGTILQCVVTEPRSSFLVLSPVLTTTDYNIEYISVEGKFMPLRTGMDEGVADNNVSSNQGEPVNPIPTQVLSRKRRPRNSAKDTSQRSPKARKNLFYYYTQVSLPITHSDCDCETQIAWNK